MSGKHSHGAGGTQSWRGGPNSPQNPKGGSKLPDSNPTYGYDKDGNPGNGKKFCFCWCGEQHDTQSEKPEYWSAGVHPWPATLGEPDA